MQKLTRGARPSPPSPSSLGESVSHVSATVSAPDTAVTLRNSESEPGRIRFPAENLAPRNCYGQPEAFLSPSQCKSISYTTDSRRTDLSKDFMETSMGSSQLASSTAPCSEPTLRRLHHPSLKTRALDPARTNPSDAETQAQMAWLGYTQELNRNWGFWPVFSLSFCNMGNTTASFWGLFSALLSGGPVVMTWGFIIGAILTIIMTAVTAELASAYPISGAMFTWTFKLARSHPSCRRWASFLSWLVGWMMLAAIVFVQVEQSIQFTTVLVSGIRGSGTLWDYQPGHTYLIASAYILFCGIVVLNPIARSPMAWKLAGIVVVILHMAICITLLVTTNQRRTFASIWTTYVNRTKFTSKVWTFLYGWSLSVLVLSTEPSAHMAEETRHAASTVPRAMFCSVTFAFLLGMFSNITATLTLIPAHHRIGKTWAIVDLMFTHLPKPAAMFVVIGLLIVIIIQGVSQMIAATRFAWALARDGVLPLSGYWRKVTTKTRIPRRATGLMIGLCMLTATTYAQPSDQLVNMMIQLSALLTASSYIVPLGLYLSSPRGILDYDGRNVWTLRSWGRPLAAISLLFLLLQFIVYSSPSDPHPTKSNWGYGPFLLVIFIFLSSVSWIVYGRSHYIGPIKSITVWSAGQEVELPSMTHRTNPNVAQSTTNAPRQTGDAHGDPSCHSPNNLTTHDVPNAFQTYASDGSMWCGTTQELQSTV